MTVGVPAGCGPASASPRGRPLVLPPPREHDGAPEILSQRRGCRSSVAARRGRILVSQTTTHGYSCARAFKFIVLTRYTARPQTQPEANLTNLAAHSGPERGRPHPSPKPTQLSRRLVFRHRFISLDEQRSGAAHRLDNGVRCCAIPQQQPLGHAHAGLRRDRRRAKEEAALGGRPEDTLCVDRVGVV
eukprot:scaffold93712_cov69-Phaeocystis_antarctica.AAC.2